MKVPILLPAVLLSSAVQAGPESSGNFSVTGTLTEQRHGTGGMLVGTKTVPKRVKVHYLDGGFVFNYKRIMYSSPRLDAHGVATTSEGQQYFYSKDDRASSVADGERYFELAKCMESS